MSGRKIPVAIIGSGNIGTDLLLKIQTRSEVLEAAVMVGIDPASDGLARARARGVDAVDDGIAGLVAHPRFGEIALVFDATSAYAHAEHARVLGEHGKRVVDLTPAAIGPYVVPVANLAEHRDAANVNMVTCGGQATIPIVWAASQVTKVHYAEIVASISSRSAGPGTRANIDEFTRTTSRGLEVVGGATRGKAIIVLNPAEPPILMRDTVYLLVEPAPREALDAAIRAVVADVARYVPGYRMVQDPVFEEGVTIPRDGVTGTKITVFLQVEGAGDYLPRYAGNLDIMTSAALRMGELMVGGAE
jgi:acetaldehyde dehydrogenase